MLSKTKITIYGIVVFLFIFLATLVPMNAADTTEQIIKQVDTILKENPLKPGETLQRIKIAEDNTVTLLVLRLVEGAEAKKHYHKTHNEMLVCVKGKGQMMVGEKWVDIKPGTVHFNPMGKAHAAKNIGKGPFVLISIYTPAMKEPDTNPVK